MKAISAAEMRELDRRTISEFEVPGEVLMDRAGWGVAETVRWLTRIADMPDPFILLSGGRALFRVEDLLGLARLLGEIGERRPKRRSSTVKQIMPKT